MATIEKKKQIFDEFAQYITPERREKIVHNSGERTRYATAVLENIYQGHNISAVLRSSDCFGMQDIHIIDHLNWRTIIMGRPRLLGSRRAFRLAPESPARA